MAKIALALSVVAVALSVVGLLGSGSGGTTSAGTTVAAANVDGGPSEAMVREARTAARKEAQTLLSETLQREIDPRVVKLETVRKRLEDSIAQLHQLAESTSDVSTARMEQLERSLQKDSQEMAGQITSLQKSVAELKARPVAVAPAPSKEAPKETTPKAPETPKPADLEKDSQRPTLPGKKAAVDPEKMKKDLDEANAGISSKDDGAVSKAIETFRTYKTKEAVPKLLPFLQDEKVDTFTAMSAASALGDIGSADAVDVLIEALVHGDFNVAQQAAKALFKITGYDAKLSDSPGPRERRKKKVEAKEWWKKHETEVRERLASPAPEGPPEVPPR